MFAKTVILILILAEQSRLTFASLQKQLVKLEKKIEQKNNELEKLLPLFSKVCKNENETKLLFNEMNLEIENLLVKQGRSKRFKNVAQRDVFLKEQIDMLNSHCEMEKSNYEKTKNAYESSCKDSEEIVKNLEIVKTKLNSRKTDIVTLDSELRTLRISRDEKEILRKLF
jgi:chromosome segregation ATPase